MAKQIVLTVRTERKKILRTFGGGLLPGQAIGGAWHHRHQIPLEQGFELTPEVTAAIEAFSANNAKSWNKLEYRNLTQNELNRSVLGSFKVKFIRTWK